MQKLKTLMTKLSWQLEEIHQQIQSIENQLTLYQEQLKTLEKMISDACHTDLHIHPEKEMSRLSFTLKIQNDRENIISAARAEETELQRLQDKQVRVKTELKLLEKYETRYEETMQKEHRKKEDNSLDELALRQRKTYENS